MAAKSIPDVQQWCDLFPTDLIPNILELVLDTWAAFKKPQKTEHENLITQRFSDKLRKRKNERMALPFKIRTEVQTIETNGRIDILFDYTGTNREEVYFALECKRLRIPYANRSKTPKLNGGEYTGEQGMMCFVSGKYSAGLNHGAMAGYVMDGNASEAIQQIKKSIRKKKNMLKLADNSFFAIYPTLNNKMIRETRHNLTNRLFTIYHIFLAV